MQHAWLLVLRDQLKSDDSAIELLLRLDPFKEERSDRWPGTTLLGGAGLATLYHFTLDDAAIATLTATVDSIYEWLHPSLPEDLGVLRGDDTTWLASIAHEGEAWLELSPDEHALVTTSIPDLLRPTASTSKGDR
jgi:hypothetical protein